MYEVDCPDCRRTFDAAADAKLVRCPNCSLEIELVSPDGPGGGHGHGSAGEVYSEAPCPHCGGLLALAPSDESGLCSHCERPLRFERARAFKVLDERGPASGAPAGASPRRSSKSGMTEKAGREWYDPDVQVNEHNAPVVELGPVDEGPSPQPETRRLVVTAQKDRPSWESRPIARKSVIRKKEVARPAARTTKRSTKKRSSTKAAKKKSGKKATKKRAAKKKSVKKAAKKRSGKKAAKKSAGKKKSAKRGAKRRSGKKATKKRAGKKAAKKRSAKKSTSKSPGKKAAKKSVKKKDAKGSSGRRSLSGSRGAR